MNFIQGDKFQMMADFSITDPAEVPNLACFMSNFQGEPIIYSHTHYADLVCEALRQYDRPVIMVTHNSDGPVTEKLFTGRPACIRKWFGQNIEYTHPDLRSIPIGLENTKWFPHLRKIATMENMLRHPRQYRNMLYVNHNISTNPGKRKPVYDALSGAKFATVQYGANGSNWGNYLENIYNHLFVACPDGNGVDTVRLWETMYMGNIPIVTRSPNTLSYTDLPICFIDSWQEVTEKFLTAQLDEIRNSRHKYNMNMLDFDYWRNLIKNERRNLQKGNSGNLTAPAG